MVVNAASNAGNAARMVDRSADVNRLAGLTWSKPLTTVRINVSVRCRDVLQGCVRLGLSHLEEPKAAPKTSRRQRGDQFWRDTVAAWKQSGQSTTAFCTARGIGESTFFAKRRELARRNQPPNAADSRGPVCGRKVFPPFRAKVPGPFGG